MIKRQPKSNVATVARPPLDKYILWVVLGLGAIGVVAVYSAIGYLAATKAEGNVTGLVLRHLLHIGIGIGVMLVFSRIDYHVVVRYSRPALIIGTGLLVLVQLIGVSLGGAQRALQFGSMMFQPAELAKVSLLVYMAAELAQGFRSIYIYICKDIEKERERYI